MILVEILDHKSQVLDKAKVLHSPFTVGRHSTNQLVVADPMVPATWLTLTHTEGGAWTVSGEGVDVAIEDRVTLEHYGYQVRLTNLNWLDELSPAHLQDETTLRRFLRFRPYFPSWVYGISAWLYWAMLGTALVAHAYIKSLGEDDFSELGFEYLGFVAGLLALAGLVSVLARSSTGLYRFRDSALLACFFGFALAGISVDGLGIRWLLGSWAQSELAPAFAYTGVCALMLYGAVGLSFPKLKRWPRVIGASAVALLCLAGVYREHLPWLQTPRLLDTHTMPYTFSRRLPTSSMQEITSALERHFKDQALSPEDLYQDGE